MGCNDEDLLSLEDILKKDPQAGPVIPETGGVRKVRIPLEGRGKSGGARVIYVDFPQYEKLYLLATYPKKEKDNLSKQERNSIAKLVAILEDSLKANARR
jgi:hypothetical protein